MFLAIHVLWQHLLELQKVHNLCESFCDRYIQCLKGKIPGDVSGNDELPGMSNPNVIASAAFPHAMGYNVGYGRNMVYNQSTPVSKAKSPETSDCDEPGKKRGSFSKSATNVMRNWLYAEIRKCNMLKILKFF